MRKLYIFLLLFASVSVVRAQSTFPYYLDWGTYVGGCGNLLMDKFVYGYSFHTDSQNNIYSVSETFQQAGYAPTYYNQYITSGGGNFIPSNYGNSYATTFSSGGLFLQGSYTGVRQTVGYKDLIGIDAADNRFYLDYLPSQVSNLSTAGVWLTANPLSNNLTLLLSKVSPSGTLLWKTYLPNSIDAPAVTLRMDTKDGSIFVTGRTLEDIPGVASPGAYQASYIPSSATQITNNYLVKLNSAGQKIWGTYLPSAVADYEVSGNSVYILTSQFDSIVTGQTTAGTFQPDVPAKQILYRFDSSSGARVWGTYFGSPGVGSLGFANEIEVSSTGIYISGTSSDLANSSYFATAGAYKPMITGTSDLYLTKFDFTGNRIWGTYFGSNNTDTVNGFSNLALFNNRIVMTGKQYSNTDNIATPGAFRTSLFENNVNSSNSYFTEFDELGNMKYCSYFSARGNSLYSDTYNPEFLSDGSLIIWGVTGSSTGIGTPGSGFPAMINPYPGQPFGYIVKFALNTLSTSESDPNSDIQLYDNPNNGDFYISGRILEKEKTMIAVYDMSGRLAATFQLEKKKINFIQLSKKLSGGIFMVKLISDKGRQLKVFKVNVK
ncbi:hypothetical protein ASG31_05590 [Chryseobacterium sp. Leaf404]|uniref:T9SS type A sorting domain-containing protein n=1 Tax=unclassified Chryseobacterium TaxID=2593645 RepID=UPI0006FFC04D|nr:MULTISPECIES: T9SS type A sorting domain-containing protein [unclassified Chryseobacterium]KQT18203.1 hypothetical protein ASG31_05590 [Chryseobacterium sp. Leaf404]